MSTPCDLATSARTRAPRNARRARRAPASTATAAARLAAGWLLAADALRGAVVGRPMGQGLQPMGDGAGVGVGRGAGVRPGRGLAAWNGGGPVTWGDGTVPALRAAFGLSPASSPSIATFLGGAAPAGVRYEVPRVALFGAGDALLTSARTTRVRECLAIDAPGDSDDRSPADASLMAAATSLLVNMPEVLRAAFIETDRDVTLTAQVLGDISAAPIAVPTALANLLPLNPSGDVAGYGSRTSTYAAFVRLFALAYDGQGQSDLHARRPDDIFSLIAGTARVQPDFPPQGGIGDALRAAYTDPGARAVAGSIRLLGGFAADAGRLTLAAVQDGVHVTTTASAPILDLTLRTTSAYGLLGASFTDAEPYVLLSNSMSAGLEVRDAASDPFVADLDTMIFKVPVRVLEALETKLVLVQR